MLTITYERLLEIYFQNPEFGYYFLVTHQPAPAAEYLAAGRGRCTGKGRTGGIGRLTSSPCRKLVVRLYAGTRPPKNGISAWLSVCGRLDVKIISAPAVSIPARWAEQVGYATRDGGRRIDPVDRPWRELYQTVQQQRIMRAGQHDRVGAGVAVPTKQGASSAADVRHR